ncbi:MAG TPA: hypothetical protein PKW95_13205 [bacterium]|nr:hypothetical protein [bacterium]
MIWRTLAVLTLVLVTAFVVVSSCDDDDDDDNDDGGENCHDNCECEYDNICLVGCEIWAGGEAILRLGCTEDCNSLYSSCLSECDADGANSWDGVGPFSGGGVDWNEIIDESGCNGGGDDDDDDDDDDAADDDFADDDDDATP